MSLDSAKQMTSLRRADNRRIKLQHPFVLLWVLLSSLICFIYWYMYFVAHLAEPQLTWHSHNSLGGATTHLMEPQLTWQSHNWQSNNSFGRATTDRATTDRATAHLTEPQFTWHSHNRQAQYNSLDRGEIFQQTLHAAVVGQDLGPH